MEEVRNLIERVLFFYYEGYQPTPQRIDELGGGWVAEESLAIGLWCALMASSLEEGVITAVNHGGDSDSTGLIAGTCWVLSMAQRRFRFDGLDSWNCVR